MAKNVKRCLIIERHDWETGAHAHQLQFPLVIANQFFGRGNVDRHFQVVFHPPGGPAVQKQVTISHEYRQSGTRRTNRLLEMGAIRGFVFFEETNQPGVYDLWWNEDKAIVAAKFHPWTQAKSSQHGRGRLAVIVPAPVPRAIDRI